MKKALSIILAFAMVLSLGAITASAEKSSVSLGTSSSGSSPYLMGSAFASVVNGVQDTFEVSAQVTGGFKDSLSLIADGEIDVAMLGAYDVICAYQGINDYEGKDFSCIRQLFPYCSEYYHLFCRADSGIETWEDVTGKKLNINTPSSSGHANNLLIIEAFGHTQDDYKIFEISTSSSYDSMRDNVIDASMAGMSIGNASLTELASSVPIHLIEMPKDVFEKFNELKLGVNQYGYIPGGTYAGQDEDCGTYISYNMMYTTDELDEETAYQLTKAFWENLEALGQAEAGFSAITSDWMSVGVEGVPYHDGAIRYYKEVGVM